MSDIKDGDIVYATRSKTYGLIKEHTLEDGSFRGDGYLILWEDGLTSWYSHSQGLTAGGTITKSNYRNTPLGEAVLGKFTIEDVIS